MKKSLMITSAIATVFSFAALISNPLSAQTVQKSNPIPDEVLNIANKSCVNCHVEPGKTMALWHVNLGKWDSYTAEKQASKSGKMCKMVTKGKMPPKKFRENNPDFTITKEEIATICNWSSSIQVAKQ